MSRVSHACFPVNGTDLLDSFLSTTSILKTGCSSVDELLDGGVWTGEVTEIVGSVGAGKTQLCLQVCSQVCCHESATVLYLDTTANFSAQRLCQIISKSLTSQAEIEKALRRVYYVRAFNIYSALQHLNAIKSRIVEHADSFYSGLKLVVVDIVSTLISPILGGQQSRGHSLMMELARTLKVLATELGLAVLCTNGVVQDHTGVSVKSALGKSWSHVPSTRIFVQAVESDECVGSKRRVSLVKSSRIRTRGLFSYFYITSGGLTPLYTENVGDM